MQLFVKLVFFFCLILISGTAISQTYIVGYNFGSFRSNPNLDIVTHLTNNNDRWPGADIKMRNIYRGLSFGISTDRDNDWCFEALLTKKTVKSNMTEFYDTEDEVTYKMKLKSQHISLNVGAAYGSDVFKVGLSIDGGLRSVKRKKGISENIQDYGWDNYWGKPDFVIGGTIFTCFIINDMLEFRPYWQFAMTKSALYRGFTGFSHPTQNFGIAVHICIR